MKILDTSQLPRDFSGLNADEIYWTYNGLDAAVTLEIHQKLDAQMDEVSRAVYRRAMDLHGPFMEMMIRGLRVDERNVKKKIAEIEGVLRGLERKFDRLCMEGLGYPNPVNWASPMQLQGLFYDTLNLPEIKARNTEGRMVPTTDREALEKLAANYFNAAPFCNLILAMRDIGKALGFLRSPRDGDKRLRCNFNLAGTNTGRLSSSISDFDTGTNLQNVDRNLRYIFVPDPGMVFVNIDLEQADSRNVGALCWQLFYDEFGPEFAGSYLDACESGDLHTTVCRMAWTNLAWPDDRKLWRSVADMTAYRTFSYRDLAKKLGHGTNYYGQPKTMAGHTKVPTHQIEDFQRAYFGGFPCIPEWHRWTIKELQTTGSLTHLYGRRRHFFNRLDEQSTINAAIAYCPQGMTGDQINYGIMNVWRLPETQLLVQVHDSILFQVPRDGMAERINQALEVLPHRTILKGGREFFVPAEAKVGYNWGDASATNPLGLKKWKGADDRVPPRIYKERVSIRSLL